MKDRAVSAPKFIEHKRSSEPWWLDRQYSARIPLREF